MKSLTFNNNNKVDLLRKVDLILLIASQTYDRLFCLEKKTIRLNASQIVLVFSHQKSRDNNDNNNERVVTSECPFLLLYDDDDDDDQACDIWIFSQIQF